MKKTEIKFLLDAGFSVEEIQAMENGHNDGNQTTAPAGSGSDPQQNAQTAPEPQQPAAAQQDPQPAAPATAPATISLDNAPEVTALLNKILGAIQAQNRSAAAVTTPQTLSPEEIAGKLI